MINRTSAPNILKKRRDWRARSKQPRISVRSDAPKIDRPRECGAGGSRSNERKCFAKPPEELEAGTGISESSLLNTRCNVLLVPITIWLRVCLRELIRSAHCRSIWRYGTH